MKRREFLLGSFAAAAVPSVPAEEKTVGKQDEKPLSEVEVFALPKDGLFSVKPHLQLLDERTAAVVWMTARKATGFVEWSQDGGASWKMDWTDEDGLRDAGCELHRTVLRGFDPSKPVKFRVCSWENPRILPYRAEFKGAVQKLEGELAPILPADGKVTFAMFNDVHQRLETYPELLAHLKQPVNLTVFAGDIANSLDSEREIVRNLLAPFAYVSDRTHAAMWYLRGNHETRGGYSRRLRDYLALPHGHYYGAVTLGAARFVFIDTGEDKEDGHREYAGLVDFDSYLERQMEWLRDEFSSESWKSARHRLAVMHIPPCGVKRLDGNTWSPTTARMEKLSALLAGANVTVAFAAHLHRSANDGANDAHPYPVIVGGGASPMPDEKRKLYKWFSDPTVTVCSYDANGLTITQTNNRGERLFERRIGSCDK